MITEIKVLFLDLDGVVNSLRSFTAFKPHNPEDDLELETFATCDPVSVKLLNMVTEKTGAKIVVSSSHRIYFNSFYTKVKEPEGFDFERLRAYIKKLGIEGEVIDATPINNGGPRGQEIKDWIDRIFPTKFPQYALGNYVIVDDGTDMLPEQKARFVQTTWENGLSIENYKRMLLILDRTSLDTMLRDFNPVIHGVEIMADEPVGEEVIFSGEWIDVKDSLPENGWLIEGRNELGHTWTENWDSGEPIGRMVQWRRA